MKYQKTIVDGKEVIYSADWILDLESQAHFNYYWNQLSLVYKHFTRDEEILEIGVGTSFLSDVLKRREFKVSTLDIDPLKKPDYNANALEFDYSLRNFRSLLAFEIFEHIPFDTFQKVVRRVSDSNIDKIIFSVPWAQYYFAPLRLKLPKLSAFEPALIIPRKKIGTQAHYWELSSSSRTTFTKDKKLLMPMRELSRVFSSNGWRLNHCQRVGCIQFFIASK